MKISDIKIHVESVFGGFLLAMMLWTIVSGVLSIVDWIISLFGGT